MRIRNSNRLGFYYYDYIVGNTNAPVCFFKASNKHIALLGTSEIPFEVTIEESTKVPLYKQAMQLQMGCRNNIILI